MAMANQLQTISSPEDPAVYPLLLPTLLGLCRGHKHWIPTHTPKGRSMETTYNQGCPLPLKKVVSLKQTRKQAENQQTISFEDLALGHPLRPA